MPRLQILQHKSYHPYLEKNKQRVREDEAKARTEELLREQQTIDAESEARLTLLRRRAGSPDDNLPSTSSVVPEADSLLERQRRQRARVEKRDRKQREREKLEFDFPSETAAKASRTKGKERARDQNDHLESAQPKWESGGHVNFWAEMEAGEKHVEPAPKPIDAAQRKAEQEADKLTMYLSRPDRETKPWYADRELKRVEDKETGEDAEERRERERRKDARIKDRNDPLTNIHKLLSSSKQSSRSHFPSTRLDRGNGNKPQSERERAIALLAKSKGLVPSRAWDTPSSTSGTWADDFERQKDRAGNRFYDKQTWDGRRSGGRSWEV